MLKAIQDLGIEVEKRWCEREFDNRWLPEIADAALQRADLAARLTRADLVEHVLFSPSLAPQRFRPFGQPPVNLFVGKHFYIEANFWVDGTTTIHDHGFSGAFCLLCGESLHLRYRFDEWDRINSHLRLGDLVLEHAGLKRPGDVSPIEPGPELVHAVFHLAKPSVTVVVRNNSDDAAPIQFQYHPPGIAEDVGFAPEPLRTQLALLDTLACLDRFEYVRHVEQLLASANRYDSYRLLARGFVHVGDDAIGWQRLEAAVEQRHPNFVAVVAPSFRERRRRDQFAKLRKKVTDEDLTFFLGLLMNCPSKSVVDSLLAIKYAGRSSEELVTAWMTQLEPMVAKSPSSEEARAS